MKTNKPQIVKTFSGWYVTFIPAIGYLRADTYQGIKKMIKERKEVARFD